MRILYGVQGTGNGHLTRARAMARAFARHPGVTIDWVFSSRPREDFFDMAPFGEWQWRRGLSFVTRGGRVLIGETARALSIREFLRDVRNLDLDPYDLVVSDFEPVTAWAARVQKRECVGIGHQYAFGRGVPHSCRLGLGNLVLSIYAPAGERIGLHWHHFDRPILPPIVDVDVQLPNGMTPERCALVYLPFEDQVQVVEMLRAIDGWHFEIFGPGLSHGCSGRVRTNPVARASFLEALGRCSHVICNCGFELISEALYLGKRILARPVSGQVEQQSNALALENLRLARVTPRIERSVIEGFLAERGRGAPVRYPDVAGAIASWLVNPTSSLDAVATSLWQATRGVPRPPTGVRALAGDVARSLPSPASRDRFTR